MKRLFHLLTAAVFLAPACAFAADSSSSQKGLPDNIMQWMSERYDAKTMLGFKWQNPGKAKIHYALEKNNYGGKAGFPGSSAARRAQGGRLDIMPFAGFYDADAWTTQTDSYMEIKYSKTGARASWNIGYMKYTETREDWIFDITSAGDFFTATKFRRTDANVLYASFVLTLPLKNLSYYGFAGPAIVSYDYAETGSHTTYSFPAVTGVYDANKSETRATWVAGIGATLRFFDSGFGIFWEYKHMPEAGYFPGMDNIGAGLSLGF